MEAVRAGLDLVTTIKSRNKQSHGLGELRLFVLDLCEGIFLSEQDNESLN